MTHRSRIASALALALLLVGSSLTRASDKCKTVKTTKAGCCADEKKACGKCAGAGCPILSKVPYCNQIFDVSKGAKNCAETQCATKSVNSCCKSATKATKKAWIKKRFPQAHGAKHTWIHVVVNPKTATSSECRCEKDCKCCDGCKASKKKQPTVSVIKVITVPQPQAAVQWHAVPQPHAVPGAPWHPAVMMPHPPMHPFPFAPPHRVAVPHPVMPPHPAATPRPILPPRPYKATPVTHVKPSKVSTAPSCCPLPCLGVLKVLDRMHDCVSTPTKPCDLPQCKPQTLRDVPVFVPPMPRVDFAKDRDWAATVTSPVRRTSHVEPKWQPVAKRTAMTVDVQAEDVVIECKGFKCTGRHLTTKANGVIVIEGDVRLQSMTKAGFPIQLRAQRIQLNLNDGAFTTLAPK